MLLFNRIILQVSKAEASDGSECLLYRMTLFGFMAKYSYRPAYPLDYGFSYSVEEEICSVLADMMTIELVQSCCAELAPL